MRFDRRAGHSRWQAGAALVCLAALVAAAICGCSRSAPPQAKQDLEKLKQKKPQRPFEELRVFTEPNDRATFDPKIREQRRIITALKPGHWTGVLLQTKSNLSDISGQLVSEPLDLARRPVELERSPFRLATSRAVALPKGQRKTLETLVFAPKHNPLSMTSQGATWIGNKLRDTRTGIGVESAELVPHMPSFQYHLVVLARDRDRYSYLKVLDSVRPPTDLPAPNVEDTAYYRVQFPRLGEPLALPTAPLCWTSTALVVWDDVLPEALSPEQQRSMLDWLHWGGGLIISGPDSLDKLRGSFLEPYLPADAETAGPLDPERLAELHAAWTITGDGGPTLGARAAAPWSGVELIKHPAAEFLPGTAKLVAQRRAGRGRIVVTSFRLNEPELIAWRSYDGFFNACLLGRPPRTYDAALNRFAYAGPDAPKWYDPELVTGVRFFTRDARDLSKRRPQLPSDVQDRDQGVPTAVSPRTGRPINLIDHLKTETGVAAWNDFSLVSTAARQTLRDAAGISVPRRSFVLSMIGLYLLVVVLVNWLVFRLAGRVEWAWAAVPVIAVTWGVLVVWMAQLDIGFARSETEVAVLELQPGYERGHLSRYTALYSSLSTSYDVHFDDASAVAMPFSPDMLKLDQQATEGVTFTALGDHDLAGFPVASNSTGMIHSEQMFDLGGAISWDTSSQPQLTNGTSLSLAGAVVIRRRVDAAGRTVDESAWLGDVEPGGTVVVEFRPHDADALGDSRSRATLTSEVPATGALSLSHLLEVAENHDSLQPGETRLVAWRDQGLAGIEVTPSASQARRATLVVANLELGTKPAPQPDRNVRSQRPPPIDLF